MRASYFTPQVAGEDVYIRYNATCYYCKSALCELPGEVYTVLERYMCESCYMGDVKLHCVERPYKRPRR